MFRSTFPRCCLAVVLLLGYELVSYRLRPLRMNPLLKHDLAYYYVPTAEMNELTWRLGVLFLSDHFAVLRYEPGDTTAVADTPNGRKFVAASVLGHSSTWDPGILRAWERLEP